MAQQGDFGLDATGSRIATEVVGGQHPVAGDQDRDGVWPAGLAYRLGADIQCYYIHSPVRYNVGSL